jgi:uncharacterized membrane protein YdjX (TVP38/TMEM64 family)
MEPQQVTPWADSKRGKISIRTQRVAALVFSLGITVFLFWHRDRIAQFSAYSYLGLLVLSIVGNATVLLPVPSLAATFVAGGIFNPLLAGFVSGVGMAIGELSGYLAGYGGTAIVHTKDSVIFQRLQQWMHDHGFVTILVLSAIPNPIFDLAGIAAGMSHYPLAHFLMACFLGKSIKGLAFALAGAQSVPWLERFLH